MVRKPKSIIISESAFKRLFLVNEERPREEIIELTKLAKRAFGTTNSFRTAGYILTDGSLLSLTYDGHSRNRDHREISNIVFRKDSDDLVTDTKAPSMLEFISWGNIRINPMNSICLMKMPTSVQMSMLQMFIKRCSDLVVEIILENGDTVEYWEYDDRPNAQMVLERITDYFNGQESKDSNSEENDKRKQMLFNKLDSNNYLYQDEDVMKAYNLSSIDIDKKRRPYVCLSKIASNQPKFGDGTAFMNDFMEWANSNGLTICVTSTPSKNGMEVKWLKRLGFKTNSGRNADYAAPICTLIKKPNR